MFTTDGMRSLLERPVLHVTVQDMECCVVQDMKLAEASASRAAAQLLAEEQQAAARVGLPRKVRSCGRSRPKNSCCSLNQPSCRTLSQLTHLRQLQTQSQTSPSQQHLPNGHQVHGRVQLLAQAPQMSVLTAVTQQVDSPWPQQTTQYWLTSLQVALWNCQMIQQTRSAPYGIRRQTLTS